MKEILAGAGAVTLLLAPVVAGEINDFVQPSDMVCIEKPPAPDFGPPVGCGDGPQPHNRTVMAQAIATSSNATPMIPIVFFDADNVEIVQHFGQLPSHGRTFPKAGRPVISLS